MAGQVQGNKRDVRELRILVGINIKWLPGLSGAVKWLIVKDHRSKTGLKSGRNKSGLRVSMRSL